MIRRCTSPASSVPSRVAAGKLPVSPERGWSAQTPTLASHNPGLNSPLGGQYEGGLSARVADLRQNGTTLQCAEGQDRVNGHPPPTRPNIQLVIFQFVQATLTGGFFIESKLILIQIYSHDLAGADLSVDDLFCQRIQNAFLDQSFKRTRAKSWIVTGFSQHGLH